MPLDWSTFVAFVHRHERFLITTHVRPDGDALGSQLALAEALEAIGKRVRRVVASPVPDRYRFMDPGTKVEVVAAGSDYSDCDAIIVVDTGTWNQLARVGEMIRPLPAERFVIDHHQTQDDLGGARNVDTTSEACGRLVREAIAALDVPLTAMMANNLFTAVATDTGWFRHSNATAATFSLAGELLTAGAKPELIYGRIYESQPLPRLRLLGLALERLTTYAEGRICAIEIFLRDFKSTGAVPMDTEDLINYPRSLVGNEIALIFIEQADGGVKVSFRSNSDAIDVAKLAERFNGGGHRRAAGATLKTTVVEAREQVLAAATELLEPR